MAFQWTRFPNRPAFYRVNREERKAALELLAAIGDHMNGGDNAT
jgi:hypothetical protein